MTKYRIVLDSVVAGAILDSDANEYIALVTTKRPDLGFEELQKVIDLGNKGIEQPTLSNNQSISNTLELFRRSVEATKATARQYLNKQSDFGKYHGGVLHTCKDVLAWIDQLEEEVAECREIRR